MKEETQGKPVEETAKPVLVQAQTAEDALAPVTPTSSLPTAWAYNKPGSYENVRKARAALNIKHGLYSGVPIVCQGQKCPFKQTCWIPDSDLEVGGRCPIEVGAIIERFDKYVKEWNITDEDTVDHSIVKDIVVIEIMMLRADNALAISGDFIEMVVAGTDDQGRKIERPELHKAFEAKQKLRAERIKLLNQMNSTRKDKKQEAQGLTDPSSIAARLMAKVRELQNTGKIVDVTEDTVVDAEIVEVTTDGEGNS
jgi:hypothetical protein